jgi:endonuclease YncB( thermonuclease family)
VRHEGFGPWVSCCCEIGFDGLDAGLEQVRAGYAWWYRSYQDEQSPTERESYAEAEQQARSQGIGLWQHKRPIPPWEYRRREY